MTKPCVQTRGLRANLILPQTRITIAFIGLDETPDQLPRPMSPVRPCEQPSIPTCLRPQCQSDRLEVTQAIMPLTSGSLGLVTDPLEASLVKRPQEQVPELLLVGVVDPALLHAPNPERGLEAPERHAERTDSSVLPVADARDAARLRAHVDIILQEVGVVGNQPPTAVEEARELRDEIVQRRAKTLRQPLLECLEVRQVLAIQCDAVGTLHRARRLVPCRGEMSVRAKSAALFFNVGGGDVGDVGGDDVPSKVWKRSPKKAEVVLVQLATGKIHRDPAHIAHRVDVEPAHVGDKFVTWNESFVGSLDPFEKLYVESRVVGTELDDTSLIVGHDGIAGSALHGCWVDRHVCKPFSLLVA